MVKSALFTCQKETEPKNTPPPDSVESLVAYRLRQVRKKQGLSLRALAERSGLNVNTLSLIENGKSTKISPTLILGNVSTNVIERSGSDSSPS